MVQEKEFFAIEASRVLNAYLNLPEKLVKREGRAGGIFTVFDIQKGEIVDQYMLGMVVAEKINKYKNFSSEKVARLYNHYQVDSHLTSFDSKNEEEEKYPGAIVAGGKILSFSGLPALSDEALMFATAALAGLIRVDVVVQTVYNTRKNREGENIFLAIVAELFKNL